MISESEYLLRIDVGDHYLLCYSDESNFNRNFKEIAKIPKLEIGSTFDSEKIIINKNCSTALFFEESTSDSSSVSLKLLCLTKGQNFLTRYDSGIEKEKSVLSGTFLGFAQNSDLMEFNLTTQTGKIHTIQLWMVTSSKELKVPYSWNSCDILKISLVTGGGACLVYLSDRGVKTVTYADIRSTGGEALMLIALHTKNYNHDENVLDIKFKQLGNSYNFLAAIKTQDRLEIANYSMGQYNLVDRRFFIEIDSKIYKIIFVKGYFFFVFKDGSISHINHDFFFKFNIKS